MLSYFTLFMVYISTMFAPLSFPLFMKSSAEFIQPNASSMLYGGDYYNVEWNMSNNVNLQFQIYNDTENSWISHINNNHFLSIVIDQTTNNYNWSVPLYLSQYWQNPSRMVLNSLDTSLSMVSDEFSIAGIYVNMSLGDSNNILFMNDNVSITWETNANSNVFNVSVYDNTTNYNNIKFRQPLYPICSNIMNNETGLCEWNSVNQSGSFVIGVTSDKLYGLSSQFHIYYHPTASPTQSPTMSPTYAPTTQNPTNTPTTNPTQNPTQNPTANPTQNPTQNPTHNPTHNPTQNPTANPTQNPTTIPTTQIPTLINKNNDNNENNDDNTLWIILISLFAAIIVTSACFLYFIRTPRANQTRSLSPHQENTTTMYHNTMANIPNNQFYSTAYSNSINHYEATPEPSPTVPTGVYVTQQSKEINTTTDSTEYTRTQFSSDVRAVKNNSYEKLPDNEDVYNRIKSSKPSENLYDKYNLENETFEC
jgi:hypothetical protein